MRLIGSFFMFTKRVMEAVRTGRLSKPDASKLSRLLNRTGKRNIILAKGILTALNAGGAKEEDIQRFSKLLENANDRISQDKEPFTEADKQNLEDVFKHAYISTKAANWFASQMDELLAEEIEEFIKGKRSIGIPTRKTVGFEVKTDKKARISG